jgi:2-keto-4-pentenoate hydratase
MPADRPYKIEVEIGIMIGKDLDEPQSADTIRGAIASVHPAIEMVLSRFAVQAPMEHGLADCQSNEAVIIGKSIEGWANADLATIPMALLIDGKAVAANVDGASLDAMCPALAWLTNQALARGLPLRKGHVIITGARLKAPAPPHPCNVTVEIGGNRQAISLNLA